MMVKPARAMSAFGVRVSAAFAVLIFGPMLALLSDMLLNSYDTGYVLTGVSLGMLVAACYLIWHLGTSAGVAPADPVKSAFPDA